MAKMGWVKIIFDFENDCMLKTILTCYLLFNLFKVSGLGNPPWIPWGSSSPPVSLKIDYIGFCYPWLNSQKNNKMALYIYVPVEFRLRSIVIKINKKGINFNDWILNYGRVIEYNRFNRSWRTTGNFSFIFKFINQNIQLAGNPRGSSETIRHLSFSNQSQTWKKFLLYKYNALAPTPVGFIHAFMPRINNSGMTKLFLQKYKRRSFSEQSLKIAAVGNSQFNNWLAGIIDGKGNFDLRKESDKDIIRLKAITIKVHNRDIRILYRILNLLHCGKIRNINSKPYVLYSISKKEEMKLILNLINGLIRIKVDSFKKACSYLNISYIEANYVLKPLDPYFSGLIDTDGSIIFNYTSNRIECNLELKYNEFSCKLNLDHIIPNYKPCLYLKKKNRLCLGKVYYSISFKFQTVDGMIFLYDYFIKNRLYSDFKFYRALKIKKFIEIRHFRNKPYISLEFKKYSKFLLSFIKHLNPL